MDTSSRYNDYNYNGTINQNDRRPTSASSSIRSQDSGVPQSDPKTSIDCSAKSESSPKVSFPNNNSKNPSIMGHKKLSSSNSYQHLLPSQQQEPVSNINTEQIREKLQPLNTQRLKPHRQATKSFIVCSN